ncbi:MAG: hypothetical protein IIB80_00665 [Thaumarchaeota archaeon]|nr:hypothetical protein [Nitrososphaerota archaeon]
MPNGNGKKSATLGGEITCIKITKDTRTKLQKLGIKGDTYETVINNLLDSSCNQMEENNELSS